MRKLLLPVALLFADFEPAAAATLTVTSTADSGPGTLRQALLDSNGSVGVLDTIAFNIPGGGVHTITVSTDLPTATDPVIIDGTTQPGYAGSPLIELTESAPTQGLRISAGQSTVRGLAIFDFSVQLTLISNGGNVVESCHIGINATATATSSGMGIQIQNSPGTRIGGTDGSAGNVISGLTANGIQLVGSDDVIIRGNLIGTDPSGAEDLGNSIGVSVITSDNVVIGGTVAGMGNLISGNAVGIAVGSGCANTLIAGNLIGTDITGTQAIPNIFGIDANNLEGPITIGTPAAAGGNLISGNNQGIFLNNGATNVTIQNNDLGTDITGTQPLPNALAILLNTAQTTDVLIGGPNPGEGNRILFNQGIGNVHGIWSFGQRITVRGNRIYGNAGLGFDNDPIGVNPNDAGDADAGPNGGQNFPIVTGTEILDAPGGVAGTRVLGVLRSKASTQYTLDFYGNDGCTPRPQDFLEGQTYLGFGQVTTDASGVGQFDVVVPVQITPGDFVSATATDPDGNTSEFSQRLPFSVVPASGEPAGGTPITIHGTDFAAGATVTIGGQPASNVNVVGSTQITAATPALAPGTVSNLTVTNIDLTTGTLVKAWVSNFLDVPSFHNFNSYVATLVRNAITAGVGGGLYGVNGPTLRQQMAVFLLKAKHGVCFLPPPCTVATFTDVPCSNGFAPWIYQLVAEGITGGCGNGTQYCPTNPVLRQQMAALLLRTFEGPGYTPPACVTPSFTDVPCSNPFAAWINELVLRGITAGCGNNNYCPGDFATRGQMAVFLTKTFGLQ